MVCELYDNGKCPGLTMYVKGFTDSEEKVTEIPEINEILKEAAEASIDNHLIEERINIYKGFYVASHCKINYDSCEFLTFYNKLIDKIILGEFPKDYKENGLKNPILENMTLKEKCVLEEVDKLGKKEQ